MATFNNLSTAIFDLLLAPFGGRLNWHVWISLLFWSALFGLVAMVCFKYCSNQAAIARTKNQIKVHLYEIRLFSDDIRTVMGATMMIFWKNTLYLANNLLPMAVMILPMIALLAQLEARYAFDPSPPGVSTILTVQLDRAMTDRPATEVTLETPEGVTIEAGPVPTPDGEVAWRLRADQPGDYLLKINVNGSLVEKGWAVGGGPRKVPVVRTKSWEAILYPGEAPLASSGPIFSAALSTASLSRGYPERDLGWMPDGELGIILVFLVVSMAVGFILMKKFDVSF